MALKQTLIDSAGRTNEDAYWVWTAMAFDAITQALTLTYSAYISAEAFEAGKDAIAHRMINGSFLELYSEFGPVLVPEAYTIAMNDPFFEDAELV